MSGDQRLLQRFEEQLRDAHASNGELRERLAEAEKKASSVSDLRAELSRLSQFQLPEAEHKRKQAEEHAKAAQRAQAKAERELPAAREEIDSLRAELGSARARADELDELEVRIEQAKSVGDLFGS